MIITAMCLQTSNSLVIGVQISIDDRFNSGDGAHYSTNKASSCDVKFLLQHEFGGLPLHSIKAILCFVVV